MELSCQSARGKADEEIFNWDQAKYHLWSREVSIIVSAADLHTKYENNLQSKINVVRQRSSSEYGNSEAWIYVRSQNLEIMFSLRVIMLQSLMFSFI